LLPDRNEKSKNSEQFGTERNKKKYVIFLFRSEVAAVSTGWY